MAAPSAQHEEEAPTATANATTGTDDMVEIMRAGVILYRRGNGFEFLLLRREQQQQQQDQATTSAMWELPKGPWDPRQEEPKLVALRNTHASAGVWPDCFQMHRDFLRINRHLEDGRRVQETFYLAEIDKKTRSGDAIDSETLPKPGRGYAGYQWMSSDLAKVSIRTDEGRLLLGQATDFLDSQDQMENIFSVLAAIK